MMKILFDKNIQKVIRNFSEAEINDLFYTVALVKRTSFPTLSDRIKPIKEHDGLYQIRKRKIRVIFAVEGKVAYFKDVGYRRFL